MCGMAQMRDPTPFKYHNLSCLNLTFISSLIYIPANFIFLITVLFNFATKFFLFFYLVCSSFNNIYKLASFISWHNISLIIFNV